MRSKTLRIEDLKIDDYANAVLRNDVKRVSKSKQVLRETKNWWELENADLATSDDEDEEKLLKRRSRSNSDSNTVSKWQKRTAPVFDQTYRQYGIDIWFAIAAHLKPDDVGRFALICKETHFVTTTALFWKIVYRRYCRNKRSDIPERFGPLCIERLYGLRTSVIKSLFYQYEPFIKRDARHNHPTTNLNEISCQKLCNTRVWCKLYWYDTSEISSGKIYTYFFKFSSEKFRNGGNKSVKKTLYSLTDVENVQRQTVATEFGYARSKLPKGLQFLDDIFANLESECFILKISSSHFTNVPSVLGMHLSDVNVALNCDMRTHRLKLRFQKISALKSSSSGKNDGKNLSQCEVISINSVQSAVVLDWWSSNYPLSVI